MTNMIENLAVTTISHTNYRAVYFVRACFADYYVVQKGIHYFEIEDYNEHFIGAATNFKEALHVIHEEDEANVPW